MEYSVRLLNLVLLVSFLSLPSCKREIGNEPECTLKYESSRAPLNYCSTTQRLSLTFVGDVLLHKQLQQQGYKQGFVSLWKEAVPFLQEADIAVANLEGPVAVGITRSGRQVDDPGPVFDDIVYTSYPMFNYHPSLLADLKVSGVDLVSTANNHSLDRFSIGADKTIEALKSADLAYTGTIQKGAPRQFTTVLPTKLGPLAFISCTFSTNGIIDKHNQVLMCYDDKSELLNEVRKLGDDPKIAGIIVLAHWGVEYQYRPAAKEVALSNELAAAGATAVVGTHSHVIQPWNMVKTNRGVVPVIHSTGNFVSGQPILPRQTSMIARLELCQNDKTKLGAWSKHGQVVVGEAGWTAARMQRTTTRTLKMALNPASSDYTKKSHDLIENLVPGFALKPKFSCR